MERFEGISEIEWLFPSGPIEKKLTDCNTVGQIFDVIWSGISEKILESTQARETFPLSLADINLFLASCLVIGLVPQPEIAHYFQNDPRGIFGNKWMQEHFTRDKWYQIHSSLHFDPFDLCKTLQSNCSKIYSPSQLITIDEMMVPFDGRWKHKQHIRGKPHNTGRDGL